MASSNEVESGCHQGAADEEDSTIGFTQSSLKNVVRVERRTGAVQQLLSDG
jgi:hypothetical protein